MKIRDLEIIDLTSGDGGKNVFTRVHRHGILAKLRPALREHRSLGQRRNHRAAGKIRPPESDPRPACRGSKGQAACSAEVQPDSLE